MFDDLSLCLREAVIENTRIRVRKQRERRCFFLLGIIRVVLKVHLYRIFRGCVWIGFRSFSLDPDFFFLLGPCFVNCCEHSPHSIGPYNKLI